MRRILLAEAAVFRRNVKFRRQIFQYRSGSERRRFERRKRGGGILYERSSRLRTNLTFVGANHIFFGIFAVDGQNFDRNGTVFLRLQLQFQVCGRRIVGKFQRRIQLQFDGKLKQLSVKRQAYRSGQSSERRIAGIGQNFQHGALAGHNRFADGLSRQAADGSGQILSAEGVLTCGVFSGGITLSINQFPGYGDNVFGRLRGRIAADKRRLVADGIADAGVTPDYT